MQDAAFVKEPLKRYCMCFGSVGLHRICEPLYLGTEQDDFTQLVSGLMPKLSLEELDLFWVIC